MKLEEIREIAKKRNIKSGKLNKKELVRLVQLSEGNPACYDSNMSQKCGQHNCLWRDDCD